MFVNNANYVVGGLGLVVFLGFAVMCNSFCSFLPWLVFNGSLNFVWKVFRYSGSIMVNACVMVSWVGASCCRGRFV